MLRGQLTILLAFIAGLFVGNLYAVMIATTTDCSFTRTEFVKAQSNITKTTSSLLLIPDSCHPKHVSSKYKKMFGREMAGNKSLSKSSTVMYTPFHEYFAKMMLQDTCADCPLAHKWIPYFEAYHDRFKRFRNNKDGITFLEIGVQSGGSIAMWRAYFGDKLRYIGIDINPETQRFGHADWINIHIGDSGDPEFLKKVKQLYPDGVDILLDDGGHTMEQQINSFQIWMDLVKPDGVYVCEDLSTSWANEYGGVPNGDVASEKFRNKTMVGRVHYAIDWLHVGFHSGNPMTNTHTADERPQDLYPLFPEYRIFLQNIKSIHVFNQIVFFERGTYNQQNIITNGKRIKRESTQYLGYKLPWKEIETKMSQILEEKKLANCIANSIE